MTTVLWIGAGWLALLVLIVLFGYRWNLTRPLKKRGWPEPPPDLEKKRGPRR